MRAWLVAGLPVLAVLAVLGFVPARADDEPAALTRARADLPVLVATLERLRRTPFPDGARVPVSGGSADDLRAFVTRALDLELPPPRAAAQGRLLVALGLLPPGTELRAALEEALSGQALAWYDPEAKGCRVLTDGPLDASLGPTLLHELAHALQDRRFGEGERRFLDPAFDRGDEALARRCLAEGEATLLELLHARGEGGPNDELGLLLRSLSDAPRAARDERDLAEARARGAGGRADVAALEARAKLPGWLWHQLLDPYTRGAWAVHEVVRRGGWPAVDALFEDERLSTEQLLHPEKAPGGDAFDPAVRVELPDLGPTLGEGWSPVARDVLGELGVRALLEALGGSEEPGAAAGWDGDRVAAWARGEETAWVWLVQHDDPRAAQTLAAALRRVKGDGPPGWRAADVAVSGARMLVLSVPPDVREAVRKRVWAEATTE